MNVTQTVPNYLGGISRQPDYNKALGMLRDMKNGYPDLTNGLQKRPGSHWEYDLGPANAIDGAKWFTFRDEDAIPYFGAIIPPTQTRVAGIRVWRSTDGVEQTVSGNFTYLDTNDKSGDLTKDSYKAAPVNQGVVILNRNVIVRNTTALTTGTLAATITTVAELPATGNPGDIYYITNGTSELDDYYVEWKQGPNTSGAWLEVAEPGIPLGLDDNTMPHILVKVNSNTFSFTSVSYKSREVGSEVTNQNPSFVDTTLENVFFYLNRIGLLSKNNVILSQPLITNNNPLDIPEPNYYRVSTLVQSPSDPVDVNASSVRPLTLRSVQPTYQGLLLFADGEQFTLFSEQGVITPNTAIVKSMSTYEYFGDVDAVELGDNHYFLSRTLQSTRVWKMTPRGEALNPDVTEVSKVISNYIPNDIDTLIPNSQNGFISLSSTQGNKMYIYRTFIEDGEILLRSWYTWELPGTIHACIFLKDRMFTITKQNNRYSVSSISLNTIPEQDMFTSVNQHSGYDNYTTLVGPYLDLWLGEEDTSVTPVSSETDSDGNTIYKDMRVQVPFNYPTSISGLTPCAILASDLNSNGRGAVFPVEVSGNFWIVKGNFYAGDDNTFVVGYRYEFDLELPTYYLMTDSGADYTAHLNINRYKFMFKSGSQVKYFLQSYGRNNMKDPDDWTEVKPQPDSQYYYSDQIPVYPEISLMLPIHQRNINFNMRIYSDSPFPVTLNKLMWEGSYNPRYYRRV